MTEASVVGERANAPGDCGCDSSPDGYLAGSQIVPDCGCSDAADAYRVSRPLIEGRPTRRGFLGRVGLLSVAGFATRFLPIGGGKAQAATTCYSWVYVGCERYCDCNCNRANMYYVYRRLCCNGGCWYEYYYSRVSSCGNLCGPCGAFLGTC